MTSWSVVLMVMMAVVSLKSWGVYGVKEDGIEESGDEEDDGDGLSGGGVQRRVNKEIGILSYPGEISHVFQAAEVAREVARRGADVTFGVWEHDMDALLKTIDEAESRDEGPRKDTRLRVCIEYENVACIPNKKMNGSMLFKEAEGAGTIRIVPFALYKSSASDGDDTRRRTSSSRSSPDGGGSGDGRDALPRNLVQWDKAGGRIGQQDRGGDANKYRMNREDKIALSKTVWNSGNDDDEVNRYAKDQLLMCPQLMRNERIAEVFMRADMLVLDGYFICNVLLSFLHNRRYVAIRSFSAWPKGGCCEPWPQPYIGGIGNAKVR